MSPCISLIVTGPAGSDGVQIISKFDPAATTSLSVGVTKTSKPSMAPSWASVRCGNNNQARSVAVVHPDKGGNMSSVGIAGIEQSLTRYNVIMKLILLLGKGYLYKRDCQDYARGVAISCDHLSCLYPVTVVHWNMST